MHAVVVRVAISESEAAEQELQERVVPQVRQAPGFVAGYWTRIGDTGVSMVVFDSEDQARAMSERVGQNMPANVSLEDVQVGEVVAHA